MTEPIVYTTLQVLKFILGWTLISFLLGGGLFIKYLIDNRKKPE